MKHFKIKNEKTSINNNVDRELFSIGFGDPAENTIIVKEVEEFLSSNPPKGGKLALVNGPASLPVGFVIAHKLLHIYSAVGVFDPKMGGYVIVSSHGGGYKVGDLIAG